MSLNSCGSKRSRNVRPDNRHGGQRPTFEAVGGYAKTDGAKAVELFTDEGVSFFPSQEYELSLMLARDDSGGFAAKTIAISKPRQNGKSFAARYYAAWMAAVEGKAVLYSAHQGSTVRKMFKALCELFGNRYQHRDFYDATKDIYRAAGYEGIYLLNGGMIEFATRTNSGGRGGTYDIVIIDEAQEFTDEQQEALKPTLSASDSGDPQMIYIGTPPGPKCAGTVFRELHTRAHSSQGETAWWLEWAACAGSISDIDIADVDMWYATNPAMGYRITEAVVRDEYETMSADGFARERLGWWATGGSFNAAINASDWDACATETPPQGGKVSFAVKFDIDGKNAAIAVCAKEPDGLPHVELIECRMMPESLAYIADFLAERADTSACFVIDGKAYAGALCNELTGKGMTKKMIVLPSPQDVCTAAQMLITKVTDHSITHYSQPDLNEYAKGCSKRVIGSSGGWGIGDGTTPGYPVEAASLALWGNETTKRDPNGGISVW